MKNFFLFLLFITISTSLCAMEMTRDGILSAMERGERSGRQRRRIEVPVENEAASCAELVAMGSCGALGFMAGLYIACAIDDNARNSSTFSESFETISGVSTTLGLVGAGLGKQIHDYCKEKND